MKQIEKSTASSNRAKPVWRKPRLKYNTSLSSLREAKRRSNLLVYQGIATPFSMARNDSSIQLAGLTRKYKDWTAYQVRNDNIEAISVTPPDKGDERGFDFPSPLKRGDKRGVLTVTPLAPLTLRGGLENNRQYP